MNMFEFITWWSTLRQPAKESLKRSVLLKRHLINPIKGSLLYSQYWYTFPNTGFSDMFSRSFDDFFLHFFSNPVFLKGILSQDIRTDREFLRTYPLINHYADTVNNTRGNFDNIGNYMMLESFPEGLELKEDIFLFHEILDLPFFISESRDSFDVVPLSLSPLKKLRWIFCKNSSYLSEGQLSEMSTEEIQGVALIDCDIENLDEIIKQLPTLKHLNISNVRKYKSIKDIECLKNHQLKTLIVRGNGKIDSLSEIISDTLDYLDCRDIDIYKEDVDELVKAMPNCKIVHNAKTRKQAAKDLEQAAERRHKDFMQRTSYGDEYPSARDAFDTDEQYNDWLNR